MLADIVLHYNNYNYLCDFFFFFDICDGRFHVVL